MGGTAAEVGQAIKITLDPRESGKRVLTVVRATEDALYFESP